MVKDFLPISREDMKKRGWQQCDFVYICGDAYVDHSSFGMAIITRLLESRGYKVGIIAQPDWKKKESIIKSTERMTHIRLGAKWACVPIMQLLYIVIL